MEFKYMAPVEYLDTSGENLKEITSEYTGPDAFKIYVSRETNVWAGTEFEYDDEDRSDSRHYQVLLEATNPNHTPLMALLTNHEGHEEHMEGWVIDEKYNMVYYGPDCHNVVHTYELQKTTISEQGLVTYAWKEPHVTWANFESVCNAHINGLKAEQALARNPELIARFDLSIEICEHILMNMRHIGPWKISFPHPSYGPTCLPHQDKI